jgi:hypothetical protein
MKLSTNNFFAAVKSLVMGGGRNDSDEPVNDAGFQKRAEGISLSTLRPAVMTSLTDNSGGTADNTLADVEAAYTEATLANNFADLARKVNEIITHLQMTADETNARVFKVEEAVDSIGHIVFAIPRDYDEATDHLVLRVLASMVSVTTDDDVKLDVELYRKRAGVALSADLAPSFTSDADVPVLSATEAWIEFDLGQLTFLRDDVAIIEIITNGANDTNGEEVLIHSLELVYRSTLVSYDETDGDTPMEGDCLR